MLQKSEIKEIVFEGAIRHYLINSQSDLQIAVNSN
jgi:hypothetical protein